MIKLKHTLIIILALILSFTIYAATPLPENSEDSFTISMNIPNEYKIKIINYGHGSIFFENIKKNNGDTIQAKRFSNLTFTIIPDDNYKVDKINFDDKDITHSLNLNKITLQNITEDGTLIINFKSKPSPITPNISNLPSNTTSSIVINSFTHTIYTTPYIYTIPYKEMIKEITDFSSTIPTGDNTIFFLMSILILSTSYMTYLSYKYLKK